MMNDFFYTFLKNQNDILQNINENMGEIVECVHILKKEHSEKETVPTSWIKLEIDGNGTILPPGKEYDDYEWVLVKLKDKNYHVLPVPRIAKYDVDNRYWITIDNNGIYGKHYRYEVVAWKPILGTEWEDVYVGGKLKGRLYRYD